MPGQAALRHYLLGLILLCSGCSSLSTLVHSPEQRLDALLAQQRYHDALLLIERLPPATRDSTAISDRKAAILNAKKQFLSAQLQQIDSLTQQQRWEQALDTLSAALAKLPAEAELSGRLQTLLQQQQRDIQQQQLELALLQSQSLPAMLKKALDIEQKNPHDASLRHQRQMLQQQTAQAIASLQQALQLSADNQQWQQALRYLNVRTLLQTDSPSPNIDRRIINQASGELALALELDNLAQASATGRLLSRWQQQHTDIANLLHRLDQRIGQQTGVYRQRGEQHYTRGDFDQAIYYWQLALQLTPEDSRLQDQLQRALRMRNNYQKLQRSEQH